MTTILREISQSSDLPVSLFFLNRKGKEDRDTFSPDEFKFQAKNLLHKAGVPDNRIKLVYTCCQVISFCRLSLLLLR